MIISLGRSTFDLGRIVESEVVSCKGLTTLGEVPLKKPAPAPKADDRAATLRAQGLDVKVVVDRDDAPLVCWNRPPTEAERAQANLILPGALHDA